MATKKISVCGSMQTYDNAITYSGQSSAITYATVGTIQFVAATDSTPAHLIDSESGFVTAGFDKCPELIRVVGADSLANNDSFIVNNVEADKLHLVRYDDLVAETTSGVVILVELLTTVFAGYTPGTLFDGADCERYALMMGI